METEIMNAESEEQTSKKSGVLKNAAMGVGGFIGLIAVGTAVNVMTQFAILGINHLYTKMTKEDTEDAVIEAKEAIKKVTRASAKN